MTTDQPIYGIADEDDIIASIDQADLRHSLAFLRDTIRAFGTEDVAEFIRHREGAENAADHETVTALAERLDRTLAVLEDRDPEGPTTNGHPG